MALTKKIDTGSGFSVNYHKITGITYQDTANGQEIVLTVAHFIDNKAREEGYAPVFSECFTFRDDVKRLLLEEKSVFAVLYELLKTEEQFKDAVDV